LPNEGVEMKSLLLITTVVLLGAVVYGQPYWRDQIDSAICYINIELPKTNGDGRPLSEKEKELAKMLMCKPGFAAALFGNN
jgi:hypothetical protein